MDSKSQPVMNRILTQGVPDPGNYTLICQRPEGLEEIWSEIGLYCPVCYPISRDLGCFSREGVPSPATENQYIGMKFSLEDLCQSAAETACQFCRFIICRIFDDQIYTFFFSTGVSKNSIACCAHDKSLEKTDQVRKAIDNVRKFSEKYSNPQFTLIAQPSDYSEIDHRYGRIRFLVNSTSLDEARKIEEILGVRRQIVIEIYAPRFDGDHVARYIKYRPVNTRPGDSESVNLAQGWIKDCLENHSKCPKLTIASLPTRLVEIQDDNKLKLVTTANKNGQYTILSYCWGGPQEFATRTNNCETYEEGFEASKLPRTLRDAVTLTKQLGLQYIWIDSLCIIQDSDADRNNELPKMASYFKNSYVTISAAGSTCDIGFLQPQGECENHPNQSVPSDLLSMPFLCPDGELGHILFREENPYCLSWEAISQRGWTFQERILSPRVLLYGGRMLWQCHESQKSAGGVEDWSFDARNSDNRRLQTEFTDFNLDKASERNTEVQLLPNKSSFGELYDLWYRSVEEYSQRKLTVQDDKLPAIAGFATEFGAIANDEYICGIWKTEILRGLMWSTYPELCVYRPDKWRAPSWSWASNNNTITYQRLPPRSAVEMAELVSYNTAPKLNAFPYGEVLDATIELRAPIIEIDVKHIDHLLSREYQMPTIEDSMAWRSMLMNMTQTGKGEASEDNKLVLPSDSILVVLLGSPIPKTLEEGSQDQEDAHGHGLVLGNKKDDTYERVGSFTTVVLKGFRNFRKQLVRIR